MRLNAQIVVQQLVSDMAPSSSGLGHRPFTAVTSGSNPVGVTIKQHMLHEFTQIRGYIGSNLIPKQFRSNRLIR